MFQIFPQTVDDPDFKPDSIEIDYIAELRV